MPLLEWGAFAASVLGAPISTTLIVFEITGDWQAGLAVMVAVSMSISVSSKLVNRSFFLSQLAQKGVHLEGGPQTYLLSALPVSNYIKSVGGKISLSKPKCWELIENGIYLNPNATLKAAMPMFEQHDTMNIPVVTLGGKDEPPTLIGVLRQVDALKAYNKAMAETAEEEHS